jgi:hypothetical protein
VLLRFWGSWVVPKVFFKQIPDVVEFASVFFVVSFVGMGKVANKGNHSPEAAANDCL